ncbi:MAG TPA: GTP-binding protein [Thermodesulfovibrionales bacterium]|nr:GTP-binding protein [Thermodesulfovibrionales bacterium]
MKTMKTTIACGLLGSGKTTFIRQFLQGTSEKAVVLVNDFGKAGIDGEIFSAGGIESIELPSGCVCCTLKFDLITTIQKVLALHAPEHLIIEPSGVASPSGVVEALDIIGISQFTVVGIVDASEFLDLYEAQVYGNFFEDQITHSDIILVNKCDLAGDAKTDETVELIEKMNPRAVIFRTVNAVLPEPFTEAGSRYRGKREPRSGKGDHFHFETMSLWLRGVVAYRDAEALFEEMRSGGFGEVVRAKALVETDRGPYRFDLSFGTVGAVPFGHPVSESRLVMIGQGLKKEAIPDSLLRADS